MRPVRFLFDENVARRIQSAIRRRAPSTECYRVGRRGAPGTGCPDPDLLLWCEAEKALLVTFDKTTLPGHVARHHEAGHRSWGVFVVRRRSSQRLLLDDLLTVAGASSAEDWMDAFEYVPFTRATKRG